MKKSIAPIMRPFFISSKIGLKTAALGFNLVKKPLEKTVLRKKEKVVTAIKLEDLRKMMVNSSRMVVLHQEEINRINVFPVADRDTGYNLAATLLGIEGAVGEKKYATTRELVKEMKEGALKNARGNAGMILTGYLIKVLDEIKGHESINSLKFAQAMRNGIKAARSSIANPVEGTILDTIKAAGEKAHDIAKNKKEENIVKILMQAQDAAEEALRETKEKLKVLKKNNVVDAGALGFVKILGAWVEALNGVMLPSNSEVKVPIWAARSEEKSGFRYEVACRFKNDKFGFEKLKNKLSVLGDSLDFIKLEDQIKIHIHTNSPQKVKMEFKKLKILKWRVEEIFPEGRKVGKKKPLGLVVGQTADLPKEFLEKYGIEEVPFSARFPDGEVLSRGNIFPKMREAVKKGRPLPTSSTPSFGDFLAAYRRALEKFEKIILITVPAKLSGTYSQARIGRSLLEGDKKNRVAVLDCLNAEIGEGLVAIKAQEMIDDGKKSDEILAFLEKFCPKVTFWIGIDDLRYFAHGGRVKLPKFLISLFPILKKVGIRLFIEVKNGKVRPTGIKFGKNLVSVLGKEIEKETKGKAIRVAIAHADNQKEAEQLKKILEKRPKTEVSFIAFISPALGTHAGPGALGVAFHPN